MKKEKVFRGGFSDSKNNTIMSTERENKTREEPIMNENENRCSTTDSVQTLTEALYLLAIAAAMVLSFIQI